MQTCLLGAMRFALLLHLAAASTGATTNDSAAAYADPRDIRNGHVMLKTGYTDQPYCATPGNGTWSCVITASFGGEGSTGEAVYGVVSEDEGRTWTAPIVVEPGTSHPGGLPNAYANIVYAPKLDRLYTVYNFNRDNITMPGRVDELGFFYMRFSDDHGYHWSGSRYLVPYPNTWIDRQNDFSGKHHIMWTGKIIATCALHLICACISYPVPYHFICSHLLVPKSGPHQAPRGGRRHFRLHQDWQIRSESARGDIFHAFTQSAL